MANPYYTHTAYPATNAQGASAPMRAELDAVMAGFALLPDPLGSGQKGFSGGQWNGLILVGGLIDNASIGSITPGSGSFTSLGATSDFTRDGLPTTNRAINFASNGSKRASLYASAGETGSDAGSDVFLQVFHDDATLIGTALKITRKTMAAVFGGALAAASMDATPIGQTTAAAGKFTTLAASGAFSAAGAASLGSTLTITSAAPSVTFGDTTQTLPNGLYRLYNAAGVFGIQKNTAAGGDFSSNVALMYFNASGTANFSARPSFNGAVPWDSSNLPNPATTSGGVTSGTQSFAGMVTFNGGATLGAADSTYSQPVIFDSNGYAPRIRSNTTADTLEIINGANNALNLSLTDNGILSLPRARPTWLGFTPWDNNNLPNPAQTTGATFSGGAVFNVGFTLPNYAQITFQGGGVTRGYMRADSTAMIGIINAAGTSWNAQFFDTGVVSFPRARPNWAGLTPWDNGNFDPNSKVSIRNGNANKGYVYTDTGNAITMNWEGSRTRMYVDGSNQGLFWTDTNFDPGSKANAGAQVVWNSSVAEIAGVSVGGVPPGISDTGSPWVMEGIRTNGGGNTLIYPRVVWLRNQ